MRIIFVQGRFVPVSHQIVSNSIKLIPMWTGHKKLPPRSLVISFFTHLTNLWKDYPPTSTDPTNYSIIKTEQLQPCHQTKHLWSTPTQWCSPRAPRTGSHRLYCITSSSIFQQLPSQHKAQPLDPRFISSLQPPSPPLEYLPPPPPY
jgi:hypothetical protein